MNSNTKLHLSLTKMFCFRASTWPDWWPRYHLSHLPESPAAHYWHHKPAKAWSLWSRQTHGSRCPCTWSSASFRDHMTGLGATWHMEKTTRPPSKMLGGTNHHGRRAGSLFLMLGVLRRIGRRGGRYDPLSVKRERERERPDPDLIDLLIAIMELSALTVLLEVPA